MVDVSNQKGDENAQLPIGKMLGEVLAEKKKRNPYYSLRSLARDSGVSHTYLSFLMHNKKRITQTALLSLLRKLPVDPSKRDELIKSSAQWHLPMEQVPTNPVQTYEDLELVQFEVITQWYHLAILEFTLTKGFKANYQWVANRLGIPTRTARTAVERLKRLGLLREEEGKWVKTHARLNFPTQAAHPAIRRFHKQMIAKAEQALDCEDDEAYRGRDISSMTFVLNPKRLKHLKGRTSKIKRQLVSFLGKGNCTELYQMNFQIFPLARKFSSKVKRSPERKGLPQKTKFGRHS